MSEMVLRVAVAIARRRDAFAPGEKLAKGYLEDAFVAIEAMREPTEEMADQGFHAACKHDCGDTVPSIEIGRAAWQAMIDEALK